MTERMKGIGPLKYNLYGSTELATMKQPVDRWVVENMVPRYGSTILHGHGNDFKTWLALGIAATFSSQERKVFGGIPTCAWGRSLVISTEGIIEDHAERYQMLLRAQNADPAKMNYAASTQMLPLSNVDGRKTFDEILRVHKPELVLLDPLIHFFPGFEENSAKDVGLLTSILKGFIQDHRVSILLIHHDNKQKGMRGSTVLYDWTDASLSSTVSRGNEQGEDEEKITYDVVIVNQDKNRHRGRMDALFVVPQFDNELHTAHFTATNAPRLPEEVKVVAGAIKVMRALAQEQGLSTTQVRTAAGLGTDKTVAALEFLEDRGIVMKRPGLRPVRNGDREVDVWYLELSNMEQIRVMIAAVEAMERQKKDISWFMAPE